MTNVRTLPKLSEVRRTVYDDGVYLVLDGIARLVTPEALAGSLWTDGAVAFGDVAWATRILRNLMERNAKQ